MNQDLIIERLKTSHLAFSEYVNSLSDADFNYTIDNWSAGQQLQHIYLGVVPLLKVLEADFLKRLPRAERSSASYDELTRIIAARFEERVQSPESVIPTSSSDLDRSDLIAQFDARILALTERLATVPDTDLDDYMIPHPVLGPVTIREMLYFTIYHAEHHHQRVRLMLGNRDS